MLPVARLRSATVPQELQEEDLRGQQCSFGVIPPAGDCAEDGVVAGGVCDALGLAKTK